VGQEIRTQTLRLSAPPAVTGPANSALFIPRGDQARHVDLSTKEWPLNEVARFSTAKSQNSYH
jgi:hypothetical protein